MLTNDEQKNILHSCLINLPCEQKKTEKKGKINFFLFYLFFQFAQGYFLTNVNNLSHCHN